MTDKEGAIAILKAAQKNDNGEEAHTTSMEHGYTEDYMSAKDTQNPSVDSWEHQKETIAYLEAELKKYKRLWAAARAALGDYRANEVASSAMRPTLMELWPAPSWNTLLDKLREHAGRNT